LRRIDYHERYVLRKIRFVRQTEEPVDKEAESVETQVWDALCLGGLRPRDAEMLRLRVLEKRTYTEIGDAFGVSQPYAYRRCKEILNTLTGESWVREAKNVQR
jgi:DNA-directed RNA polymerase specialized sigma24 family protein